MLEAICLLTAGVFVGRLWAWLSALTQDSKRSRYGIHERTWDALDEINDLRRQGQEAMYRVVQERRRS